MLILRLVKSRVKTVASAVKEVAVSIKEYAVQVLSMLVPVNYVNASYSKGSPILYEVEVGSVGAVKVSVIQIEVIS